MTTTKLTNFNKFIAALETTHKGSVLLEKKIIANGAWQVTAYVNGRYIQHIKLKLIPPEILENIPLSVDYSKDNPPCIVCGALGTELHHWMPQYLSDEAHLWPQDYLCRKHHLEWHSTIIRHSKNGGKGE